MHFKGLDLNLLAALDVLLLEKNTTRAGERLCLSQSAVSGALARLREYFNDELLVPAGRTLVLTPLAESLIDPVREVLRQVETTIATKARFDAATSARQFNVMSSDYAMTVLLARALRRAVRDAPAIAFTLRQTTVNWQDELARGLVDVVLIPEMFASEAHPREALFTEDFLCIADTGNERVGDALTIEQFFSLGHVGMAFGQSSNLSIDQLLLQKHGHRRIEVIAPNFTVMPSLVLGTNRIAVMHARLARQAAETLPLRLLPPPIELPGMVELMQWPAHHTNEPGSLWLRALLRETAREI